MEEFRRPTTRWELPVALAATAGLLGGAAASAAFGDNERDNPGEVSSYSYTQAIGATCSIEQIEYNQFPMGPGQYALSIELAVDGLHDLAKNNLEYAASIVRSERDDTGDIAAQGQVVHGGVNKGRAVWENSSHATVYFDPGESTGVHYGVSLRIGPQFGGPDVASRDLSVDCGDADFVLEQQGETPVLVESDATVVCATTIGRLMRVSAENADESRYIPLSADPRRIATCED